MLLSLKDYLTDTENKSILIKILVTESASTIQKKSTICYERIEQLEMEYNVIVPSVGG